MIPRILSALFIFAVLLCSGGSSSAAEGLCVKKTDVTNLQKIFSFYGYEGKKGYLMLPEYAYPPLFVKDFPAGFNNIKDENKRHALFIKILAPLAMQLNQEILNERSRIEHLYQSFQNKKKLSSEQRKILEETAAKYDVFTRLKKTQRYEFLFKELLEKINIIPPSVLITAAALETDWGTLRIAEEGNALYKQLQWHTKDGIKPKDETEDDTYRIRTYPSLHDAMADFALKLNSALAFKDMRFLRQEVLSRGSTLTGTMLAHKLIWNSPLQNYAGLFEYTLAYYELNVIDKSHLDSKMISRKLPPELAVFTDRVPASKM